MYDSRWLCFDQRSFTRDDRVDERRDGYKRRVTRADLLLTGCLQTQSGRGVFTGGPCCESHDSLNERLCTYNQRVKGHTQPVGQAYIMLWPSARHTPWIVRGMSLGCDPLGARLLRIYGGWTHLRVSPLRYGPAAPGCSP